MYILVLFFLTLLHPLLGMHSPVKEIALGVQTLHYVDEQRERPIVVEFWYPAERANAASRIAEWGESRGAPMRGKKETYPLILISHGYQGDRRDLTWLAECLVRQGGCCVAAIDHFGDTRHNFDIQKSVRFWDRTIDCSFLLNQLEKDPLLSKRIDFQKIGFVGYSLGGMTGLGLLGAQASNVQDVFLQLQGQLPDMPSQFTDQLDFSDGERSFFESRICGAFLICPAVYPYSGESLKQVKRPVGLVVTVGDEVLPFNDHAVRLIRYLVPQKLKVLREEISHFAFMHRNSSDRNPLHAEVGHFALEFFREILKCRKSELGS